MSSTGRGGVRADSDFYPTPAYAVDRLLERWMPPGLHWLELGAGNGDIIRAVNAFRARHQLEPVQWMAVESRPACAAALRATGAEVIIAPVQHWYAATAGQGLRFDAAPMNPPFSDALTFVSIARARAKWTVCLERAPWLADSEDRYRYFIEGKCAPSHEYRVGRIDFDGRGGDSIPYSWFAFPDDGLERTSWQTIPLAPTPSKQRERGVLPPTVQPGLF